MILKALSKPPLSPLGADAIIGFSLDVETLGQSMLMVSVVGTAVRLG